VSYGEEYQVLAGRAFRGSIVPVLVALTLAGCMRHSGPVAAAPPQASLDAMAYGQGAAPPIAAPSQRGLFTSNRSGAALSSPRRAHAAMPTAMASDPNYHIDSGDKLRVLVYGQEGLTNTYAIDAGGVVTLPLIGAVPARGQTPAGLAAEIAARLRNGFIREPSVAVEIESYRPFFILGEVAAPGQYPYVPNMSVESAVAIAGGFSPRAKRDQVILTRGNARGMVRAAVPLGTPMGPGDTVLVGERWF
jgi:polysaccharide export outer membrane protein